MPRDLFADTSTTTQTPRDLFSDASQPSAVGDAAKSFFSQVGRNIPEGLDLGGSALAATYNAATGGNGDYFKGFMQPRQTPMSDLTDAAVGPKYQPQTTAGKVSQFAGGFVGPSEAVGATKIAKNAVGVVKGLGGSMDDFLKDPAAMKEAYLAWKGKIDQTPITGPQIKSDIVDPFMKATQFVRPNTTDAQALAKVQKLDDYGKAAGTQLGYLYGLRQTLGEVDNSIAQPMRDAIDGGLSKYADTQGLTDYSRYKQAQAYDEATKNMGNETVAATSRKINNLDPRGMSPEVLAAKQAAGRGDMTEGLLRMGSRVTGAIPAVLTGIGLGSPAAGIGIYGVGQGLKTLADQRRLSKIADLQNVIMNNRAAPSMGERFGAFVRGKVK